MPVPVVVQSALAVELPACVGMRLVERTGLIHNGPVRVIAIALGRRAGGVREIGDRAKTILVIEQRGSGDDGRNAGRGHDHRRADRRG